MNNQLTKKLIACDLDGTLLDNNARLSEANKEALDQISARGALFVPTSGRALYEITSEVRDLDCVRYLITSNGALVIDKLTGRRISTLISKEDFSTIYNVMADYTVYLTIHHEGISFVDEDLTTREIMDFYGISEYYKDHIEKVNAKMPFFKDYFNTPREVEMVCGFFKHESELKECMERLSAIPSIFVTGSTSKSLEILSAKATKGSALVSLANELGVDISDTIAVGDSQNDLTMIQKAGFGLATANAVPALKDAADLVICSNEENVAVHILENMF